MVEVTICFVSISFFVVLVVALSSKIFILKSSPIVFSLLQVAKQCLLIQLLLQCASQRYIPSNENFMCSYISSYADIRSAHDEVTEVTLDM